MKYANWLKPDEKTAIALRRETIAMHRKEIRRLMEKARGRANRAAKESANDG